MSLSFQAKNLTISVLVLSLLDLFQVKCANFCLVATYVCKQKE